MALSQLLEFLLPKVLMRYEINSGDYHFYFSELNTPPTALKGSIIHSKGFYAESQVEDFPIRGKSVRHHIKRRKWKNMESGEIITRDWNLVAKGTRMTEEFAYF